MKRILLIAPLAVAVAFMAGCANKEAPGGWSLVDTGTGDAFYLVNFVDEQNGWLNGQTDRSFEAFQDNTNGNKNAPAPNPEKKIEDPLKANQGFEVLQTTDGGTTWRQIPEQFKYKIRQVWFVDTREGWALTIDRDILHTSDGGATWALQRKAGTVKLKLLGNRRQPEMDQPEQIDRVHFIDSQHGWAWGGGRKDTSTEQPGIFLITTDGGQNWNQIDYPFDQNVWGIFFLNAQHAWVSTEGSFYRSSDGGTNWTKVQTKLPEMALRSIFFLDEKNGWVATRGGRLARTEDGGKTWINIYKIKLEYIMRDVHFMDEDRGWAVGSNGAIIYTPDGGDTWVSTSGGIAAELTDVQFVNDRTGWAAGPGGALFRFDPAAK